MGPKWDPIQNSSKKIPYKSIKKAPVKWGFSRREKSNCAKGRTRTDTGKIPHAPQVCRCSSVKYVYEGKQPTNYSKLWHIMENEVVPIWSPFYKTNPRKGQRIQKTGVLGKFTYHIYKFLSGASTF